MIDFQQVFDIIETVLPEQWGELVFRAEYREGCYTMKYYVKGENNEYIDCYDIPEIKESDIVNAFIAIDKVIYPERQLLAADKKWSVMTFVIDSDGRFKSDYSYADIDTDYDGFISEWKTHYIPKG